MVATRHSLRVHQNEAQGRHAVTTSGISREPRRARKSKKGMSTRPFPPLDAEHFGMIQSLLYAEPFWLLVAVTLLNKTPGSSARPIFWSIKERYPDASSLAAASQVELCSMVQALGLQTQRSKRIIQIATAWAASPPKKGICFVTKDYPTKLDGKGLPHGQAIEANDDACAGLLEIGHLPGCGPYAWDSWRIFCRDILRGKADDYNGLNAESGFEPEWKRVVPLDKELRACLRWMWLRDGLVWDPQTGATRPANQQDMDEVEQRPSV